jgi:ADP-ribose pyrophosphatase YjhB (NUDIX family)
MRIRCVAHAVIRRGNELLVTAGDDWYRCVGGGIEFTERSEDAVRREVREELGVELSRVDRLGVLENVFDFDGRQHHQIAVAFDCDVADASFYARDSYDVVEAGAAIEQAFWVALGDFTSGAKRLVPDGLLELVQSSPYQSA